MKEILCFGDSNTFGFIPGSGQRYNKTERWSGILSGLLSENYRIIEAGCNNRTAFCPNPEGDLFTGTKAILTYLDSHRNLDLIILALGANDLQFSYKLSTEEIYKGIKSFIKLIKNKSNAKILLVCPSIIKHNVLETFFAEMFDESSIQKSKTLPEIYKKISEEENILYLDLNNIAQTSDTDGLHYTKEAHKLIATTVERKIKQIL